MSKYLSINSQKGQAISFDLVFAIFLFLLFFTSLRLIAYQNIESTNAEMQYNEMVVLTQQAIDSMLKTQGYPEDWNYNNVKIIGLVNNEGILVEEKLDELLLVDYKESITKIGLAKYDFLLEFFFVDQNNSIFYGKEIQNYSTIVVQKRNIMYGGGLVNVTINVYK